MCGLHRSTTSNKRNNAPKRTAQYVFCDMSLFIIQQGMLASAWTIYLSLAIIGCTCMLQWTGLSVAESPLQLWLLWLHEANLPFIFLLSLSINLSKLHWCQLTETTHTFPPHLW